LKSFFSRDTTAETDGRSSFGSEEIRLSARTTVSGQTEKVSHRTIRDRFTIECGHTSQQSLHRALVLANEWNHEYATLEHLLLALIDHPEAAAIMHECNVDTDKLCGILVAQFESRGLIADGASDPKPAADFERVIRQAVILVQHSGREEITGGNVLVAILAECESRAAYFLQEQDLTVLMR
jgi:ATP-dependent Clp protease ATP-binding subunit ClpA